MSEPVEKVSAAEAAFDAWRQRIALVAGPMVGLLVAGAQGWDRAAVLSGIMAFAAIWWIGEAVPAAVVSLVSTAAVIVLGIAPARQAFASYGDPLLFLFVGSFFIAEAMHNHGLGDRVARAMARQARGRLSLLMLISGTAFLLSMWMSNAAATAVCLPIAISAAHGDRRFGAALVLSVAYGASVGGLGTPVGTPPNLIGIARLEEAGVHFSFVRWMSIGVPIGAVMMAALWTVLSARFGVRRGQPLHTELVDRANRARPWTRGEKVVAGCFLLAVVGWLVPGLIEAFAPESAAAAWTSKHLSEEVVALLAAAPLFVLRRSPHGEPVLTWREATRIDWGTIIFFAGGMVLGSLAKDTGLTERWGTALVAMTGADSTWAITALVTGVAIVLSELTSNTATAVLIVPLAISLAQGAGIDILAPAIGATIGASFGFMMPISTAPNAMAYGTGQVSIRQMIGAGVPFDLIGYGLIVGGLALLL